MSCQRPAVSFQRYGWGAGGVVKQAAFRDPRRRAPESAEGGGMAIPARPGMTKVDGSEDRHQLVAWESIFIP
jgi:hypothetical protein